jgi:hypothetical protein
MDILRAIPDYEHIKTIGFEILAELPTVLYRFNERKGFCYTPIKMIKHRSKNRKRFWEISLIIKCTS